MVFPLVIVGTREADGGHDLAPKHMAMPMSWENHYGFVCAPTHRTYQNIVRDRAFTVSLPTPEQVLQASLAAAPRATDGSKHSLAALSTVPATMIDGVTDFYASCADMEMPAGSAKQHLTPAE